jgi:hypothetical protein
MYFRTQETISEKSNNFILQLILTHLIKAHKFDLSQTLILGGDTQYIPDFLSRF